MTDGEKKIVEDFVHHDIRDEPHVMTTIGDVFDDVNVFMKNITDIHREENRLLKLLRSGGIGA